jgi:hypothetical protein
VLLLLLLLLLLSALLPKWDCSESQSFQGLLYPQVQLDSSSRFTLLCAQGFVLAQLISA